MIKVGCCGFPVSMKKYYDVFGVVEVNKTFYEYPKMSTVEGWRVRAPVDFEFTVKAHQDISHKSRLEVGDLSLDAFERMKRICEVLKAKILLIQTSASFRPDSLDIAYEFFGRVVREGLTLVWETRGSAWESSDVRERLGEVLRELGVVHVTDPFRCVPVYVGDVVYFRLHGLGGRLYYYQFSDVELRELFEVVRRFEGGGRRCVYVLFNNLAMFEDAFRFKCFVEEGVFPGLTGGAVGLESVRYVLGRTRFPVSKSLLLRRVGWRLVVLEGGRQVRVGELLRDLPSGVFGSLEDVLREVRLRVCK